MLWHHSTLVLFTKLSCSYTVIKRKHISRKPLTKPNNSDVQLFEVESLPSTDVVFHGIMGLVPMTWSSGVHSSLGGMHCIHSAKIVKRTLYVHAIDVCIIFRHYSVAHRNDSCFSRWSYAVPPQARNKMLTPLVSPCSIVHLLREPFAANVLIYSTEWAGNKALTLKAAGQSTAPFPRCFKLNNYVDCRTWCLMTLTGVPLYLFGHTPFWSQSNVNSDTCRWFKSLCYKNTPWRITFDILRLEAQMLLLPKWKCLVISLVFSLSKVLNRIMCELMVHGFFF